MAVDLEAYDSIMKELAPYGAQLVAVSKTKPVEDILELYRHGHRDFGENYVQELVEKQKSLPADIRWHFIGHLQSNKAKTIAPFVYLVHGVDSLSLLKELNRQGARNERTISCLLQVHIAQEETKFGLSWDQADAFLADPALAELQHVCIRGLMGMATLTDDVSLIKSEFSHLKEFFNRQRISLGSGFDILSMGMTSDYLAALESGSNMVRIGSAIFGER